MMRIALTGYDGFLGSHVQYGFYPAVKAGEVSLTRIGRKEFADPRALSAALAEADVVVHLAGMNRGSDEELLETNRGLAEKLVSALKECKTPPQVIYSSTTHIDRDSAYGRSKKEAGTILAAWGEAVGAPVAILVLPHLFGEFQTPKYNSVFATFCNALANGETPQITEGARVQLLYAGDAVDRIREAVAKKESGEFRVAGNDMLVSDAYALLENMRDLYDSGVVPAPKSRFEERVFATLHSYLFASRFPKSVDSKIDERGHLVEIVRHAGEGQTFFSTTKPQGIRGNHYHTRKIERFCVVAGSADVKLRKLLTEDVLTFAVSGDNPVVIDMPTYYAHSLTNTGTGELSATFWVNERYNPEDPDTYPETV